MAHYYIVCDFKNKEKSQIWQELKPGTTPRYGKYKPDDPKIAPEMALINKYLSEHTRLHGGITEVRIVNSNGKVPVDPADKIKEAKTK